MTVRLNKFQKRLCNLLQEPLPVCARPFESFAERLAANESAVITEIKSLKSLGLIRRFGAFIDPRLLGKAITLVAAHIPGNDLPLVTTVINALPGVSHNYLRDHHYNLWFTLQADTRQRLQTLLANLSLRLDTQFHSLPAVRVFKLDVRFIADSAADISVIDPHAKVLDVTSLAVCPATLSSLEKNILMKLQCDLEVSPRPFDFLVADAIDIDTALRTIQSLMDKHVVRRIGAVLDYRRLGFDANVMFCARVEPPKIPHVAAKLARFRVVSHCYERETFEGWPYNLFAMVHARSFDQIRGLIDKFTTTEQIGEFELLPTTAELKKQPVRYDSF